MSDLVSRSYLLSEYDRQHQGPAGGARKIIEEAPSAEQWIPCSERLPDKETYVIISKKPHPLTGKKWCVTIAGRFVDERNRKIVWLDIGFGRIADDEILAWMPFPELYRKENGK